MDNYNTREFIEVVRTELAADEALKPTIAKLYSQYTRLKLNQPGLKGWNEDEFTDRLTDAITLIDAGLSDRELGGEEWRQILLRAGEILEWLSHPELNTEGLPIRLLSAGIYQLAGYPALALGLLNHEHAESNDSQILIALLKGDFPRVLSLIIKYWSNDKTKDQVNEETLQNHELSNLDGRIVDQVIKSLGLISAYMRWDEKNRLENAKQKLRDVSDVMLYSNDKFSWILSKIISEVVTEYIDSSMRKYVKELQDSVSDYGKKAFEKYLRLNYNSRKSLAWNSQVNGIERLVVDGSFALCTPTGSGKTTIAELAIIQSMFNKEFEEDFLNIKPIVMYLVPSRALATEVEMKLKSVLGNLGDYSVQVTGLYGGIDWGPLDVWMTTTEPTVLICTYEKGEALIRFLGPLFVHRISLVVIDEAHLVQYKGFNYNDLRNGDDRSLRLEMLASRLIQYVANKRVVALSAVADDSETLAQWISLSETATPIISNYRSTRQLIGRLEWSRSGQFIIQYDKLNGSNLEFNVNRKYKEDVPYIKSPFSPFPVPFDSLPKKFIKESNGADKRQRPYLFWAAMQLAQADENGVQHPVLISVTQNVGGYADDFLYLLNNTFADLEITQFFKLPTEPNNLKLYERSLNVCADYFGENSIEYQLLKKGVLVHHGNMPGLLARLLVELIQNQIIHIVIATSTLSDGVNLPFETVIIPTLLRSGKPMSTSEFRNLSGRAGRPGWGTEGRTLIFLESNPSDSSGTLAEENYFNLVDKLSNLQTTLHEGKTLSPLGTLMNHMVEEWIKVSGSLSITEFMDWLEKTIPLENVNEGNQLTAEGALDSLDGYLISIMVEKEMMDSVEVKNVELEKFLIEVWRKTYANYVVNRNEFWEKVFALRGRAIQENIYPDAEVRRRLYRTSVSPRFGKDILAKYKQISEHLKTGVNYPVWSIEDRLQFIIHTVELIGQLDKFRFPESLGGGKNATTWKEIIRWWLNPTESEKCPTKKQTSLWIKFIKKEFEYKFNWGIGTVMALILDDTNEGILQETSIEDWPKTELPWIVFWIKELISWGTFDPVAALLLANGVEDTRTSAEIKAKEYYLSCTDIPIEEILNPNKIRKWINQFINKKPLLSLVNKKGISVNLTRDFGKAKISEMRVLPLVDKDSISWIDPAGYELAKSKLPDSWGINMETDFDFVLNIESKTIKYRKFL